MITNQIYTIIQSIDEVNVQMFKMFKHKFYLQIPIILSIVSSTGLATLFLRITTIYNRLDNNNN